LVEETGGLVRRWHVGRFLAELEKAITGMVDVNDSPIRGTHFFGVDTCLHVLYFLTQKVPETLCSKEVIHVLQKSI
jgi:hypothetical protein